MSEPRQIAVVSEPFSDSAGFIAAIQAMREKRNVSCERLDEICGLPKGYVQKLLSETKGIGPISMFPLAGGVGTAMVLVDDPEALRRIAGRLIPRNKSQVRSGGKHKPILLKISRRQLKKLARLGGLARGKKLSKSARRRIARKAARARWRPKAIP